MWNPVGPVSNVYALYLDLRTTTTRSPLPTVSCSFIAYFTKSAIRHIVRCPMTVRFDIASVHGEQRPLLRLGESGVHAQRGFRCIIVGWERRWNQASLCE